MAGEEADNILAGDVQSNLYLGGDCAVEEAAAEAAAAEHELTFMFNAEGHPNKIECTCGRAWTVTEAL